ncbi:MAG TPA: hypothetical protein VHL08_09195 [Dongiaceae bacterium]|nr:hypothetical protein [Dongiaceae bacterium]
MNSSAGGHDEQPSDVKSSATTRGDVVKGFDFSCAYAVHAIVMMVHNAITFCIVPLSL